MLSANGLAKRYGDVAALDGFDLRVEPGEIAGLVGHNGAGKTTFFEIAAGLVRADAGSVVVRGEVGMAPQQLALYPSVTVRETLRLFGGLAGLRRRALAAAIDVTAEEMALTGVLDRRVSVLPGGQQRRTQAATALLAKPEVLLLDEPHGGRRPRDPCRAPGGGAPQGGRRRGGRLLHPLPSRAHRVERHDRRREVRTGHREGHGRRTAQGAAGRGPRHPGRRRVGPAAVLVGLGLVAGAFAWWRFGKGWGRNSLL
ncbi:ABC transporter ATP-binding protein [Nonomuraea sp. NPDC049784]|uniref:ABC transporter ATP-binding protein n=1 Tax=Nonomuraea sp. NPDC049784 TaxID=3154361 RepID=UPI0033FC8D8E